VAALILVFIALAASLKGKPWHRHTIDNSSKGADGVRLADMNADGRPDIVTGWEEGGLIRVYLNPGKADLKRTWPAVTVGRVKYPEDAVPVDLDGDGAIDVVSSCEGQTRAMFVHWAPHWTTEKLSAAPGLQWMFALPMQVDGAYGIDLVIGSKGAGGKFGWLAAPEKPRDLASWKFHEFAPAGWIMSIASNDIDKDGDIDVVYSDRKGKKSGVYWLENRRGKAWVVHPIGLLGREVMFLDVADLEGMPEIVAAVKQSEVVIFRQRQSAAELWQADHLNFENLPIGRAKAVTVADVDLDRRPDLILTCEGAGRPNSGVIWVKRPGNDVFDISGPEGVKFDLAPAVDLDGDGDLDVITTEETENLGVIWYENPTR
jgi:FG-GAP-like repeat